MQGKIHFGCVHECVFCVFSGLYYVLQGRTGQSHFSWGIHGVPHTLQKEMKKIKEFTLGERERLKGSCTIKYTSFFLLNVDEVCVQRERERDKGSQLTEH